MDISVALTDEEKAAIQWIESQGAGRFIVSLGELFDPAAKALSPEKFLELHARAIVDRYLWDYREEKLGQQRELGAKYIAAPPDNQQIATACLDADPTQVDLIKSVLGMT